MDEFKKWWAANRFKRNHPASRLNPENIDGIATRVAKEGVAPESYLVWTDTFTKQYPGALIDPSLPPANASASDLLAYANGEKLVPSATPKPKALSHITGRTSWDVIERQKAEAAAKKEKLRTTRNPFRASHIHDDDDDE